MDGKAEVTKMLRGFVESCGRVTVYLVHGGVNFHARCWCPVVWVPMGLGEAGAGRPERSSLLSS